MSQLPARPALSVTSNPVTRALREGKVCLGALSITIPSAACQRNGIAGGPHVASAEALQEWADRGATFMSCGFDGDLLLKAFGELGEQTRQLMGDRLL
jgi:hypothetical protein